MQMLKVLLNLATTQNFVPVVDDEGIFIGIIKRSDIINYCYNLIRKIKKYLSLNKLLCEK